MRLFQYFIIFFIIVFSNIGGYQSIHAASGSTKCDATSSKNAAQWLKDCSGDAENAISPVIGGGGQESIKKLVVNIAEKVLQFGALFAIGAIVYSGIQYTTSYGDDEKIKKAKTTGIYALTGLFLLLTAFSLVNIIVNFIYSFSVN